MEDIIKIVRGVSETIQNELKKKKRISWLLATLGASLLGNMLAGKGINRAGEGITRAGYGSPIKDLKLILKYKNTIKMNPDLMGFLLEII